MIVNPACTVSVKSLLEAAPFASVTVAVKVNDPATVGVPSIFPSAWNVNPAGTVPAVADHVYGGVPPDATIEAW